MPVRLSLILAAALAAASFSVSAQPPTAQSMREAEKGWSLSGSVRVRYETLNGQPRVGLRLQDEQLAIRSTLAAEYRNADFRIGGEIYDSRAYLDRPGSAISSNEVNTLELVQAYLAADLDGLFGTETRASSQIGRMMLNLGSRRLVAADDYRNTTNGYTGVRADIRRRDGATATLIYTLPQIRLPDDIDAVRAHETRWDRESFNLRLWGGVFTKPAALGRATAELSYFRLQEFDSPDRPTRNRNLHTMSGRLIRDPAAGKIDFEAEGIFQLGDIRASQAATAGRLPVRAWFIHLDVGYSFAGAAKLRVSAEFDYASGDGPGRQFNRFDTLFGMRRADLAPAGIYNAIGRSNISTPGLRVEIAPTKRFDAFTAYRGMWLASSTDSFSTTGVRDASGRSGSFAGQQIEARMRYWVIPKVLRGEFNALWLAKGRFMQEAPNAPRIGDTHYMSAALTMTF